MAPDIEEKATFDPGGGGAFNIKSSMPSIIQRHNISDEELDMLCQNRRDMVLEILWISIGAFIGSMSTALTALLKYFSENSNSVVLLDDLIQMVIFFSSIFLTTAVGIIAHKRHGTAQSLQEKIRARAKKSD